MKSWLACLVLQRLLLPLSLVTAVVLQQNGLSALYLVLLLYNPAVPVPTSRTMSGHSGFYQKLVIFFTIINISSRFIFQIVLIVNSPYGKLVKPFCGYVESILRYCGLVRLDGLDWWTGARLLAPDCLMLVASLSTYWGCAWLNKAKTTDENLLPIVSQNSPNHPSTSPDSVRNINLLTQFGKYVCLALLCCAGALVPSLLNGLYYVVFLGSMTVWACNQPLGRAFAYMCRLLVFIIAAHIVSLFLYQMQWAQEALPPHTPVPRYLGLTALVKVNCSSDPRVAELVGREWAQYVSPLALVILYLALWYEADLILNTPASSSTDYTTSQPGFSNEKTPLIRGRESLYRRGGRRTVVQDCSGSVTLVPSPHPTLGDPTAPQHGEEEVAPGLLEAVVNAGITIGQLLAQSSYIATNIIMMAWSITYHSWVTFVLLLWAMVMWLMPNQRRAMLRSSPFLIVYAQLLLLAQYLYGMDLTDQELPQQIQGLNLNQIGFIKIKYLPVKPIIIKSVYTVMFWITLKQYNQEKWEARNQCALADIASPLQIGALTATGVENEAHRKNEFIEQVGRSVRGLLTKFWIWVVASILFAIGISGDKITIFRMVYMALALLFIITFQLSWALWRRIMYGFWLTVIIYSMLILVMTYTYQFDNFPQYWTDYLHINDTLQSDIGLEQFDTKELFIKLLTPTFFVIITVIQLYYFHTDFLALSDIKSRGSSSVRPRVSEGSSTVGSAAVDPPQLGEKNSFHLIEGLTQVKLEIVAVKVREILSQGVELGWLFLELHMLKVVMFSLMLLAVLDVCAMHMVFVLVAVVALSLGSQAQTFAAHVSSVTVSLLLLARMIYQIKFLNHDLWTVDCSHAIDVNKTFNTAEWLGFTKVPDGNLPNLLKGYIAVIIVLTVNSVVVTRQKYQRHLRGRSLNRPNIMFPRVSYREADRDINTCLKYLLNYGFFRFGIEVCVICVVTLVGMRMDFAALLYTCWLCLLVTPRRSLLGKIWPFFIAFTVITIPLQYAVVVGLPPNLCQFYPWDVGNATTLKKLQNWMFLPDPLSPPKVVKVLYDFVVLMVACRQGVVFRIERKHADREFHGGTNKCVVEQAELPGFHNPVPDFISHVRSWLDVVKRVVFSLFIWVTLAIVFLAGTNRVNIFSLGYLIGAFIFLWQGNDFFLRPINTILKWWNMLIMYNMGVILVKTALQIVGCILLGDVPKDDPTCWLIQIFSISCIQKFDKPVLDLDLSKTKAGCTVANEMVGIAWDGFCLGFLILQRRLFNSYYFFHIVDETKAMTVLASRGAELIDELSKKQISEQQECERNILEKIKNKMDRIKASQQKIQGPSYKEPVSHAAAIRSGDYYMFDDVDEEELDLVDPTSQSSEAEDSDDQVDKSRSDVFQLLSTAMKTDVEEATAEAKRRRKSSAMVRRRRRTTLTSVGSALEPSVWRSCSSLPPSPQAEPKAGPSHSKKDNFEDKSPDGDQQHGPPKPDDQVLTKEDGSGGGEHEREGESLLMRLVTMVKFLWALLNSVMVTITRFLNKFSRDYRYVIKTLSMEKKLLKEKKGFGEGMRVGGGHIWQPLPTSAGVINRVAGEEDGEDRVGRMEEDDEEEGELSARHQSPMIRLVLALWFAVISHSELVCYFTIFLHQIRSPSLLSLPLPLMVFLWGTLTVPRPSKNFWVTIIAYTEVVVVIKWMFQFEKIPWNQGAVPDKKPFFPPRILGIERSDKYAYYDLLLLLIVFFHRSMLKSLGLWTVGVSQSIESSCPSEPGASAHSDQASPDSASSHHSHQHYVPPILSSPLVKLVEQVKQFFRQILKPSVRVTADVYAYMFFCDFINFFVIIFGFSSFGSSQSDSVAEYFEENKVPIAFLVMLILQFGLIIIDRTLYLRKFILGKIIFQYILVIGIHIWMFFILPYVTERSFNAATPPQIWYIVKCFYLLLSAYQIRSGYPTRILGNFLCKSYNYINMYLFKIFMAVPFVFELRALMDWIWTDTSMTLSDWLKMEDIFAHIFQLKCQRRAEMEYPMARGERRPALHKYLLGGGCLAGIIAVIWFPLVLFALGNTVGQPNLPYDVTVTVRIGAFQPIYKYSAQNNSIYKLSQENWVNLSNVYWSSPLAQTFLSNYEYDDVGVVVLSSHSTSIWTISPPDNSTLVNELLSERQLDLKLEVAISRNSSNPDQPGQFSTSVDSFLPAGDPNRKKLVKMLKERNTSSTDSAVFPSLLPKFLKVIGRGAAKPVPQLMTREGESGRAQYKDLNASLRFQEGMYWWQLTEQDCAHDFISQLPLMNCSNLVLYTFNDKAFPPTLNIISGKGIVGLYTTFVILIHSFIRQFFTGISFKIMFDDMPNVDRLLQLCLDIYLVRESLELDLEEDLFAKLVFLYRSPETLIKWTRPPDECVDPDEPEQQAR